jgi:hypothetical protein
MDSSDIKAAKPVRPLRGVVVFGLAVTPLVLLAIGWAGTARRSYYVAGFTPSGAVQGIATHHGRLILAFSNVSFGRERGLTALSDGLSPDEFDDTYQLVYDASQNKRERWGFGYVDEHVPADNGGTGVRPPNNRMSSVSTAVIPTAVSHMAFVVPLWAATLVCILPPTGIAIRGLRRWRRWRGGKCLCCGYDLRGSEGRCPECGTPF